MRRNAVAGDEVSRLWRKHQHATFPARLQGADVAGVDLVALDAGISEYVDGWRSAAAAPDEDRRKDLTRWVEDLDAVLPLLTSRGESLYFDRLRQVATLILAC